jgi:hypothetical protein
LGTGGCWEMLAREGGGRRWVGCCGLVRVRWLACGGWLGVGRRRWIRGVMRWGGVRWLLGVMLGGWSEKVGWSGVR